MRDNRRLGTSTLHYNTKALINQQLTRHYRLESLPERISQCFVPGFLIRSVESTPANVEACRESKARWRHAESGLRAELIGACLFQAPSGGVIAVVKTDARLVLFDGELEIALPTGTWMVTPLP